MKVLHVTQGYYPAIGGTEFLIQKISEELTRQFGDEVTVFTTNCYSGEAFYNSKLPRMATGWEELNGVKIRRFPVRTWISQMVRVPQVLTYRLRMPGNQYLRAIASGPIVPGLRQAIRAYPADVIAASSFPLLHMFDALAGARASNRPCILHGGLHPADDWGFSRPMIYDAIRKCSHYIANTEYEAQWVCQQHGIPREHVETIGVGVDPEPYHGIDPQDAKRRLGLEGLPVVGFIGQLSWAKGVGTLLKAMPLVWQIIPEARLLLAGHRTLFADQLEAMVAELPEQDRHKVILQYNFANEEKPWLFSAIDVLAYPSGFESFGIAYLEAWAAKKPVVGSTSGAIPWVIDAGVDGLLVPFLDFTLLAEALIVLLRSPNYARLLGEAGYRKMIARYTWSEVARRFRAVYERKYQAQNALNQPPAKASTSITRA